MKLHLGFADILVILVICFASIIGHNWWNAHPTWAEYKVLQEASKTQQKGKSQGGGGMSEDI